MDLDILKVNQALNNSQSVVLTCNCSVRYSGRAESFLAPGDRIILIKADRTILIHQPEGSNPVNYMKEASHKLAKKGDGFLLSSHNIALKEYLDIELHRVYNIAVAELQDSRKIEIVGSEKDMADLIYEKPDLIEKELKPLSREEHTTYGFIDVFCYDKNNTLVIIECKRYTADLKAVDQLQRYVKKMKELRGLPKVRGIIASPKISDNALKMLQDLGYEWKSVSPPHYLERYDKNQMSLGEFK